VQFLGGKIAKVQVPLNTPLCKVLDQACQKFNFEPSDYALKHGRATIDLSIPVRYSNLPNKAHLEAVKALDSGKNSSSVVSIALQFPSGDRIEREYSCTSSLMKMLSSALPHVERIEDKFSVVYMRQSFVGIDQLQSTRLSDLGLFGGKAVIRLLSLGGGEVFPTEDKMDTGKPSLVSAGDSISRTETSSTGTNEAIPIATGSIDSQTTAARSGSISILDSPQLTSINTEKKSFQKDFTVFHKSSFQESLVEELPNSFFEVTVQDVQLMQHLLQRTAEATANPPLQTQSMKQISVNTEHRRYERAVVRIQFPDGWILQGVFTADETLRSVVLFLREHLADPNTKFHLYTSPPKTVLKGARRTLEEAGLAPASLVYFATDKMPCEGHYLSARTLSMVTTDSLEIGKSRADVLNRQESM
jgi:tether containing UBX domain for GLUT4